MCDLPHPKQPPFLKKPGVKTLREIEKRPASCGCTEIEIRESLEDGSKAQRYFVYKSNDHKHTWMTAPLTGRRYCDCGHVERFCRGSCCK